MTKEKLQELIDKQYLLVGTNREFVEREALRKQGAEWLAGRVECEFRKLISCLTQAEATVRRLQEDFSSINIAANQITSSSVKSIEIAESFDFMMKNIRKKTGVKE